MRTYLIPLEAEPARTGMSTRRSHRIFNSLRVEPVQKLAYAAAAGGGVELECRCS